MGFAFGRLLRSIGPVVATSWGCVLTNQSFCLVIIEFCMISSSRIQRCSCSWLMGFAVGYLPACWTSCCNHWETRASSQYAQYLLTTQHHEPCMTGYFEFKVSRPFPKSICHMIRLFRRWHFSSSPARGYDCFMQKEVNSELIQEICLSYRWASDERLGAQKFETI